MFMSFAFLPSLRRGGGVGTVPPEISPPMPDKAQILIADLRPRSLNRPP